MAPNKRPHNTVTLAEKCKILDFLDKVGSIRRVAEKFNVPKSTVSDIKKNKTKIRRFVSESFSGAGKRQVIRKGEHPEVEAALYKWFLQQRSAHVPVSSDILRTKAKQFYERITGKSDFLASSGWLDKFKKRHGIRFLKVCGEKLSSDVSAIVPFQEKFLAVVNEMKLSRDQVYNADESAAFWRALPDTTWVHSQEQSAPGRKISKDRVTFMPCCNAAGTHKLPLLVLGKSANPRAFKNATLPVKYKATSKGWMTRTLFFEWFKTCFIPDVKRFLSDVNRPHKALLLVDNAPSHPPETEINFDPDFRVMFLPPNCTAVLQPMDQNLIQNIKVAYRKRLLNHIIAHEGDDLVTVLKQFNLKDALVNLDIAWKLISEKNIQKSWIALWPNQRTDAEEEESDEENIPLSELQRRLCQINEEDLKTITASLLVIDPENSLNREEIVEWALGKNEVIVDLTEEEVIGDALKSKDAESNDLDGDTEIIATKVKHSDAVKALTLGIQWAEENYLPMHEILLLKNVKEKAIELASSKLMKIFFWTLKPVPLGCLPGYTYGTYKDHM
ncbi:jerky protein homolog-like [Anthonomus grandis grandis]|uniref:jerky protein homolog-like n=1 Tax=Anthonomus grandis grandis TaxID=2921223 RepID=UPI002166B7AF|nr:jerky protein homolog-like [Anthonomus grandis grandis]